MGVKEEDEIIAGYVEESQYEALEGPSQRTNSKRAKTPPNEYEKKKTRNSTASKH